MLVRQIFVTQAGLRTKFGNEVEPDWGNVCWVLVEAEHVYTGLVKDTWIM